MQSPLLLLLFGHLVLARSASFGACTHYFVLRRNLGMLALLWIKSPSFWMFILMSHLCPTSKYFARAQQLLVGSTDLTEAITGRCMRHMTKSETLIWVTTETAGNLSYF